MSLSRIRAFAIACAVLPLGLVVSDGFAAPPATSVVPKPRQPPNKPKHPHVAAPPATTPCAAPTAANCRDLNYLVTACGQRKDSQDSCGRTLSAARKPIPQHSFYKATAKNFDINTVQPPEWVNDKFTPYVPGQAASWTGRGTGLVAKRERERFALGKQYTPTMNLDALKNAATAQYESDGNEVHSCDEYVYKYYYDWNRFEDAAAACGKDYGCVADVGLGNRAGPKIAGKAGVGNGLRQKSPTQGTKHGPMPGSQYDFVAGFYEAHGLMNPLSIDGQTTQFALLTGDLPKNAWFTFASQWLDPKWLTQIFGQKWSADFQALASALSDGALYYNLSNQSTAGNNEKFDDEWAWHKHLRQKTKNVPDEQVKQIAHRTALVEALLLSAGTPGSNPYYQYETTVPESITKYTWGVDPYGRLQQGVNEGAYTQNATERRRSRRHGRAPSNGQLPPTPPTTPPAQSKPTLGFKPPPPNGWTADTSSPNMPQFLCTPTTTPILVMPGATYEEGLQAGMARCKLFNMYLAEWWRKKRNEANGGCKDNANCGCLHIDPANNSAGCDWSSKGFNDRWVGPGYYQKQRQAAQSYCENFGNVTPGKPGPAGDPSTKENADLEGYESYMRRGEKAMAELAKIPNRPGAARGAQANNPGIKKADWGQLKQEGSEFGDRDFFAGSYDARAGWELRPVALIPSTPKQVDDKGFELTGQVCQMTGELYGVFQASAWIFGGQINAVDGDAWLVLNDTRGLAENSVGNGTTVPTPKNMGDGNVHYEAHLIVLGYQLFATTNTGTGDVFDRYEKGTAASGEYVTDPATKPVTLGTSHDSWNIPDPQPEIPFSIGPIPCYISGYAELSLDVEATAQVDLPTDCTRPVGYPGHKFGPRLQVTPSASLAGVAEAGVGIAGIISVGVRGELTIVDLQVPITTSLTVDAPKGKDPAMLNFGIGVDGFLTTLGGAISVYFQLLFFDEEIELFSWGGIGPSKFQIVPSFHTKVPLPAVQTFVTGPAPKGKVWQ